MTHSQRLDAPFENVCLRGKSKKIEFLSAVLAELLNNGLVGLIVIKRKSEPIGFAKYRELKVISKNGVHAYCLSKKDQIPLAVELLIKAKPWYRAGFTMIFGGSQLPSLIEKNCSLFKERSIPDLEEILGRKFNGYFFPLDNELLYYGRDSFRNIILRLIEQDFRK